MNWTLFDTITFISEMLLLIALSMMWGFCLGWTSLHEVCKLRSSEQLCYSNQPIILLANGSAFWDRDRFEMLYGEPLELFCVGENYDLEFTVSDNRVRLPTTIVNKTTIRLYKEKPEKGISHYICQYIETDSFYEMTYLTVIVDSLPVVENFNCKSMHFEYLNCTWISNFYNLEHMMYYVYNGTPMVLCRTHFYHHKNVCLWDTNHPLLPYEKDESNLTFIMNSCTGIGCTNQTFILDHVTLVKYRAPVIELRSKSAYSVVIGIDLTIDQEIGNIFLEQKITYWYSGMHPNQTNASLTRTNNYYNDFNDDIELKLPCANEIYEVRVSVRPQHAVGEDYWSDEGVIHFATDQAPDEVNATVDSTCNQPRSTTTPDVMLYLIAKRTEKIQAEQNELKLKIESLKLKTGYGQ